MSTLTAMKLNEQIVSMRKVVEKVRVRVCRKLVRHHEATKGSASEKKKRKAQRLLDELKACKIMRRDDVSKFALLNLKSLNDLNIRGDTPIEERVLYRLATENLMVSCVSKFRQRYPEWHQEVPFLLQRLGLQYQSKKNKLPTTKKESSNDKKEAVDRGSSDEQSEGLEDKLDEKAEMKGKMKELVDKVVASKGKKKKKKKKKTLAEKNAAKQVLSLPKPDDAITVLSTGQGVIRWLGRDGSLHVAKEEPCADSAQPSTSPDTQKNKDRKASDGEGYKLDIGGSEQDSGEERAGNQMNERSEREGRVVQANPAKKRSAKVPESSDGIHPSWAAKKREVELMKRLMHDPVGKRKVFDED